MNTYIIQEETNVRLIEEYEVFAASKEEALDINTVQSWQEDYHAHTHSRKNDSVYPQSIVDNI